MQKERVKMMIVVACASVGSGPSDARPEHYHGRDPDPDFYLKALYLKTSYLLMLNSTVHLRADVHK